MASTAQKSERDENLLLLRRLSELPADDEKSRAALLAVLTERNMGLVRAVAGRYRERLSSYPGTEMEDLIEIGVIGMLKAIRSFDLSYETTFSTYAVPLIVGEIRRHLRDDGPVKVSRDLRRRAYKVFCEKEGFTKAHGREPTASELAACTGTTEAELVFLLDAASPVRSLSEPIGGDGEETFTLESVLGEEENAIDRLTDSLSLAEAVAHLPEFERKIIALRYRRGLSQQQTAKILSVTQVKISRTEKKIFAYLKKELTEN